MDKNKRIKHESRLNIGGNKIRCYVLEDETRVFNKEDLAQLFLLENIQVFCHICGGDISKISRMLGKLESDNYKVFEALLLEIEKGLKFICDSCEDKLLEGKTT